MRSTPTHFIEPQAGNVSCGLLRFIIPFTLICLSPFKMFSQQHTNVGSTIKFEKYFREIELAVGPTLLYPNAKFKTWNNAKRQKIGYAVQVALVHPVSRRLQICPGFSFERKGIKSQSTSTDNLTRLTGDLTNDYFTFAFKPRLSLGKKSRLNIDAGCYVSLLTQSKTTYAYDSSGIRKPYFAPMTEHFYKKYDFGVAISFGYIFQPDEKKSVIIQILNSNGLVDIEEFSWPSILSMSKNNALSFLIGLQFNR